MNETGMEWSEAATGRTAYRDGEEGNSCFALRRSEHTSGES